LHQVAAHRAKLAALDGQTGGQIQRGAGTTTATSEPKGQELVYAAG